MILRAGRLSARFEQGHLRDIRWNGIEAIRGIAWLVRDRDWGTAPAEIRNLRVDGFSLSYDMVSGGLVTAIRIQGRDDMLRLDGRAVPDRDFVTNRTGLTILHPIDGVAGAWARITHGDGSIQETGFPDLIAPWQPFQDIAAITHRIPGAEVTCEMTGDVFEMEDQRNWSDASFKTYVRPLSRPWPYTLPAGQEVAQSVTLSFRPAATTPTSARVRPPMAPMPQIGLVIAPDEVAAALRHIAVLRAVTPQRIRCHLDPTKGQGAAALADFARLQAEYPAAYDLEYVVACDGDLNKEMQELARAVVSSGLQLASLAVCPAVDLQSTPPGSDWPDCPPLNDIYVAARAAFALPLGGGMFSYFTELNRKPPPKGMLDYVTHGTNPIVHAADDENVMQTLQTIPHILRSARALIGDRSYHLGPTMIGMRQNPYGARTMPNPQGAQICMTDDDPRQRTEFGAAFTAGYAMAVAGSDVAVWLPAAFTGPRGIVSDSGALWPIGHVVAMLCGMAGKQVVEQGPDGFRLQDGSGLSMVDHKVCLAPPPSLTQPK